MSEQAWALVRAATTAGKWRAERAYLDWYMRGCKGTPPDRSALSVLRFAPMHTAADLLRALGDEGWELVRVNEEAPRAPSRPSPVDAGLLVLYCALLLRGTRKGWATWKIAALAWAAGERWIMVWRRS